MPKYYCDYCDTFLTHDSPSVRKTHCNGRKHKENVKFYYQKWMEDQAQSLIDATIGSQSRWRANTANQAKWDHLSNQAAAFKAGKALSGAFSGPKPPPGAILPPPPPLPPGARFPVPGGRMPPMMPNMPPPPIPGGGLMMPPMMPGMRPGGPPPFAPPPSLAALQALQSAQQQQQQQQRQPTPS